MFSVNKLILDYTILDSDKKNNIVNISTDAECKCLMDRL